MAGSGGRVWLGWVGQEAKLGLVGVAAVGVMKKAKLTLVGVTLDGMTVGKIRR